MSRTSIRRARYLAYLGIALSVAACSPTAEPTLPIMAPTSPTVELAVEPTVEQPPLEASAELEVPVPSYDPVAWKLEHGLLRGPADRSLVQAPAHTVGSVDGFFVRDDASDTGFTEIKAELLYQNDLVSMWVEDGLAVNTSALSTAADTFAREIMPILRDFFGQEWSPGVDNDPRLSILHLPFLADAVGEYSSADQYLSSVEPFSNQREMFYVSLAEFEVGSDDYMATLAHEFEHMIQWRNDPSESTWLDEGLAQLAERIVGYNTVTTHPSFLGKTNLQLNAWPSNPAQNLPNYGGSYLFLLYLWERFGDDLIRELARHPEDGMAAVRQSLAQREIDAHEVFGDWTVANLRAEASPPYGYAQETLRPACPVQHISALPSNIEGRLPQYSTDYLRLEGTGEVELGFRGSTRVGAIPANAASGTYFWWSNRGDNVHSTLTRSFDLTGLERATLLFQTWHDIELYVDSGYVSISTDWGESWDFLNGIQTIYDPAFDYGPNYTGVSGSRARPEWVSERIDLSPYVDSEVQLRFEYVTTSPHSGHGWAIDDIAIPEIDYLYDVDTGDGGWIGEGFIRTRQAVDQDWAVYLALPGEVRKLQLADDGSTSTRFSLSPDQSAATVVIAAMAPRTKVEATYKLSLAGEAALSPANNPDPGSGIFFDDFSDECSGWEINESAASAYGYRNEALYFDLKDSGQIALSNPGFSLSDVVIDVRTMQAASAGDNSWGVVCRYLDVDNYYGFEISDDQYFTIYAFLEGEFVPLQEWSQLASIATGDGAQNRLSASCVGDTLSLYLHGQEIASVTDGRLTAGDIGLTASTYDGAGARVLFDNLRVETPDYASLPDVLLYEDFGDPGGGWNIESDGERAVGYLEGEYFIDVFMPDLWTWSLVGGDYGDVVVEVDTRIDIPTTDNSWGLFCRYLDADNQYAFEIGNDGLYVIYALVGGDPVQLTDWMFSTAINTGPGAKNHIRVSCVGDELELVVNGVTLATARDSTFQRGDVALVGATYESGGSRVLFDNLVLRQP
ncbi:MAG: hypothetical protein ACE5M4_03155 [Anaerolineales bacterium]